MTERKDGLVYMLAFCLLLALVAIVSLLRGTTPPPKMAAISKDDPQPKTLTQQELNIKNSK